MIQVLGDEGNGQVVDRPSAPRKDVKDACATVEVRAEQALLLCAAAEVDRRLPGEVARAGRGGSGSEERRLTRGELGVLCDGRRRLLGRCTVQPVEALELIRTEAPILHDIPHDGVGRREDGRGKNHGLPGPEAADGDYEHRGAVLAKVLDMRDVLGVREAPQALKSSEQEGDACDQRPEVGALPVATMGLVVRKAVQVLLRLRVVRDHVARRDRDILHRPRHACDDIADDVVREDDEVKRRGGEAAEALDDTPPVGVLEDLRWGEFHDQGDQESGHGVEMVVPRASHDAGSLRVPAANELELIVDDVADEDEHPRGRQERRPLHEEAAVQLAPRVDA
mmetsp:Transcript_118329/g.342094  ORF Transcript_118329/g.342094 Transcript_118329/m.342094 type:complete len:338 (+) Transcript_118329:472-1485(+)